MLACGLHTRPVYDGRDSALHGSMGDKGDKGGTIAEQVLTDLLPLTLFSPPSADQEDGHPRRPSRHPPAPQPQGKRVYQAQPAGLASEVPIVVVLQRGHGPCPLLFLSGNAAAQLVYHAVSLIQLTRTPLAHVASGALSAASRPRWAGGMPKLWRRSRTNARRAPTSSTRPRRRTS